MHLGLDFLAKLWRAREHTVLAVHSHTKQVLRITAVDAC